MDRLSDTAMFVQVMESGSFTAAADTLDVSKSAVSKAVSRLEDRLGVRLINRTTRKLSLTEAGEGFLDRASRALADLADAEAEVTEHADQPRGRLRVTAPSYYGAAILTPRLGEFRERYPQIQLELELSNRFVDLVAERMDVAVRMSAPRDSSLVMRSLGRIPMVAAASPDYLERRGRPESPEDLGGHDCLVYSLQDRPRDWVFGSSEAGTRTIAVTGCFQSNDDHALRQAALEGFGVLRMPKLFLADELASGRLVQLFDDRAMPPVTLAAVYPSRQDLPAKVRAFVDFLAETD